MRSATQRANLRFARLAAAARSASAVQRVTERTAASASRRRLAMPASSLRAKPGTSSMRPANSRWPSTTSSMSVSATTVALRGAFSSRASSPKASPGPRVAILRPWRVTRAVPSRITKNSWPVSPSEIRALPAGTRTSSARRATSWRSLREQAAKSGTCWRWSMNASRRAMGRESNDLTPARHAPLLARSSAVVPGPRIRPNFWAPAGI